MNFLRATKNMEEFRWAMALFIADEEQEEVALPARPAGGAAWPKSGHGLLNPVCWLGEHRWGQSLPPLGLEKPQVLLCQLLSYPSGSF